mmetsp:Transcript_126620/g.188944  ORF Transcript_126620/g.188944 Transcript_126620/m.188944 type:complete len:197 (-) Transcript_126620:123-713(-)|eukprot:CAMPEP_0117049534 /NCGR_PEP_ID=MMETSP0472-20121206/34197_1 /TAXON_ID=693140 ORGANISM="Tiarina fusus, Strain LIS" /NCGR_SAMPLE_ID=MMETSP0472 /ASSEMBLY_ACC=CAM_ASM_000603 /LENGTH=196 /DNA_ID=CAMNT_0004762965 /DNA_START=55 /DNA_END=645 /DNA_ORIENTATION=+
MRVPSMQVVGLIAAFVVLSVMNEGVSAIKPWPTSSHLVDTKNGAAFPTEDVFQIKGGAEAMKTSSNKPAPFFLRPRFLFKFQAIGTASFGIPALLFPKLMHPIFATGDFPSNTFYYWMFALRELFLATLMGMASTLPASEIPNWQLFNIAILVLHSVLNIFHGGWNPLLQPVIIGAHAMFLLLCTISYVRKIPADN